jgi:ATP-dependent Clp protease ATP-binding subunit ClpA
MADEIDKADPNLQYIFMQAADKGELKDNRGRTANFRNAILIFAGNFNVRDTRAVGFKEPVVAEKGGQQNLPAQVSAFFVPAMLGRADVIKFSTLTREQVAEIADKFVAEREEWIARKKRMHVDISLTEEAKYRLADLSNSNDTGARELDRVMRYHVDTQLADKIIAGELRDGGTAVVDVDAVTHKFNVAVAGGPPVQPGAAVAPYSANGTPRPSLN